MENLTSLDFLAFGVILVSVITALLKGFARELISFASVIAGVILAGRFYREAEAQLLQSWMTAPWSTLTAFVGIFVLVVVLGSVLAHAAHCVLKTLCLKWLDRLLGGAFGLLRGWLLVAAVFLALAAFTTSKEWLARSYTAPFFLASARWVLVLTPQHVKDKFYEGYRTVLDLWMQQKR